MNITKSAYGKLTDGRQIDQFTMENDHGMIVKIITYGGIITNIITPDKNNNPGDVAIGFDNLEGYLGEHPYFGAIVGRFANRIEKGHFVLNNKEYKLAINNGPNALHGGIKGFDKQVWTAFKEKTEDEVSLSLAYESPDMEEGFPGNLLIEVSYILNNNNELIIKYKASSDKDTVINLTNHSYFNLNTGKDKIFDHKLRMEADFYTPLDENQIPTGEIAEVKNTPFDFTIKKSIGKDFDKLQNGYDHNFIINKKPGELKWFAIVEDPLSGRLMEVATTEPGVQLYTSNFLDGIKGKDGQIYSFQDALCLETQHFPDSPNKPQFPSVILKKDDVYTQTTIYRFSIA
jgi:aldose 1-epimerase